MKITKITYEEYKNDSRYWRLEELQLDQINLLVGKNATGKTRTLNVLSGLCKIIRGEFPFALDSGTYDVEIKDAIDEYRYLIMFQQKQVIYEKLFVNNKLRIDKKSDGTGEVYFEKKNENIEFKLATNIIALTHQRDEIQHPYVLKLVAWATNFEHYIFSNSKENDGFVLQGALNKSPDETHFYRDTNLISIYISSFEKFGEDFDKKIISDMNQLGFPIDDVGAAPIEGINHPAIKEPVIGLFVREKELPSIISQHLISQGMFRALSLIIKINTKIFNRESGIILIDDISEGLDYSRSKALVRWLTETFESSEYQLIMSSNDQFVMNAVPIQNWTVLKRTASVVTGMNIINSKNKFEELKNMGLNNSDLFMFNAFEMNDD